MVGAPLLPGPVFAAPYHLGGRPAPPGAEPPDYGRVDNPTWQHLERALADLDGATETVLFPSGMAAISAVLFAVLRAGGTLVIPSDGYFTVRPLAADWVAGLGVSVRQAPTPGPYRLDGASLVLLETPSNPGLEVCDLAAVAAAAHQAGALVAVDNTTATPLGQRPLALGADLVLASDTKALAGHSDLLLGHVS